MIPKIVGKEDPVLREIAKEVPISDITSPAIQNIIQKMKSALASQNDGVAIAAPQIGESLCIFVVSGKATAISKDEDPDKIKYPETTYINPKITKVSKTKRNMEEGCLSVRYLYGKVKRATKATVEAYDENGKKFTRGASGLLAQIFQHETDHLKGVLFIDTAQDVVDLPPQKHSHE